MLKVVGMPGYETAINQTVGVALPVEWVTITNPDPTPVSVVVVRSRRFSAVFLEGLAAGGARFRRLEGCWYGNRRIFFISTNGGNRGFGQVWEYDIRRSDPHFTGRVAEPRCIRRARQRLRQPAGWPGVLRGRGRRAVPARGLPVRRSVPDLARNLRNSIEFAGACFSPDGRTLFANLYGRSTERTTQPYPSPVQIPVGPEKHERAATVAIWGPWRSGPL